MAANGSASRPDRTPAGRLEAEVVIPLKWADDGDAYRVERMTRYLSGLRRAVTSVTVVDGSPARLRGLHEIEWGAHARIIEPDPEAVGTGPAQTDSARAPLNGKVVAAMTGIRQARHDAVVLADDDVRHTADTLAQLVAALDRADLVRPLNVYGAWPWQARWDGARTLVNVALGTDWPGTFALRRSTVLDIGGWSPDVLFENLELWRTVEAAGHETLSLPGVGVLREPPSVRQFWSQRVRQAYDDLAQPGRLVAELAIVPLAAVVARGRPAGLGLLAAASVVVAAVGRRRVGANRVPPSVPLWAPVWVAERGVCTWLALGSRLRGGVRYHGSRVRVAAHSNAWLRRSRPVRPPVERDALSRGSYPIDVDSDHVVDLRLSPRPVGTSTA